MPCAGGGALRLAAAAAAAACQLQGQLGGLSGLLLGHAWAPSAARTGAQRRCSAAAGGGPAVERGRGAASVGDCGSPRGRLDQSAEDGASVASTEASGSSAGDGSGSGNGSQGSAASGALRLLQGQREVSFQTHPLPPYPIDEEEQQSLDKATAIISRLSERGCVALIVGGWVRDKYLGRRASDIDIATSAPTWQLRSMFRDVVELPRSTVKLTHQGEVLEVTTFRGISRAASALGLAMDAERRDFTINALYYDPPSRLVLDLAGGAEDARARVLRLVADPAARLAEDPLRVLRGVRFAAALGLRLAPATARAMRDAAHTCCVRHGLPPRRIWLELRKLHRADREQPGTWARALKLSQALGLLPHLFPWVQPAGQLWPQGGQAAGQAAVQVAERLAQQWRGRQVPLALMVAATVHPAADMEGAFADLQQYFQDPGELLAVRAFMAAAALARRVDSVRPSGIGTAAGPAAAAAEDEDDSWASLYAHDHAQECIDILAAWMPDLLAESFRQLHEERRVRLADRIARHKQLLRAQAEQQRVLERLGQQQVLQEQQQGQGELQEQQAQQAQQPSATAPRASERALHLRRQRQREELAAAIQALVGEQQEHQEGGNNEQQAAALGSGADA